MVLGVLADSFVRFPAAGSNEKVNSAFFRRKRFHQPASFARLAFPRRALRAIARILPLCLTIPLAHCAFSNIDLVQDRRVRIVAPEPYATLQLPLHLTWTWTAPEARTAGLDFGVFVDRSPIAPGASLRTVAKDDKVCEARPGCPDKEYLAARNIYTTRRTSMTFTFLPDLRTNSKRTLRDQHRIIIILLKGGYRVGEGAFVSDFYVARRATS
jgi:hypothetical protein